MPQTLKASAEVVEGVVVANMTNWRDVFGNLTIKLQFAPPGHYNPHPPYVDLPDNFTDVHQEFIEAVSNPVVASSTVWLRVTVFFLIYKMIFLIYLISLCKY